MKEKEYTKWDEIRDFYEIKSHAVKSFFWNLSYSIKEAKWWILHRFHPKYRYHVLKFRKLKPGWHDVDYKMLHACFDLFCDFVEKEDGLTDLKYQYEWLEKEDPNSPDYMTREERASLYKRNKEIYEEALYLYNWWNKVYPTLKEDVYVNHDLYSDETEHLIRLIKIRGYFWR